MREKNRQKGCVVLMQLSFTACILCSEQIHVLDERKRNKHYERTRTDVESDGLDGTVEGKSKRGSSSNGHIRHRLEYVPLAAWLAHGCGEGAVLEFSLFVQVYAGLWWPTQAYDDAAST